MVDNYQNQEHSTLVGFEFEAVNGVDPAAGRIRWPGRVMRIPTLQENFLHEAIRSLGGLPDPNLIVKGGEEFEIELEFLLQATFAESGGDELLSNILGSIDGTTGVVTPFRPLPRTFVVEYGWTNPLTQVDTITITGSDDGTYTVFVNGVQFDFVAVSSSILAIRDGLVTAIGTPAGVTVTTASTDQIVLTSSTQGVPFSDAVASVLDNANINITRSNASWYQNLLGCKIQSMALTIRPNALVMCRLTLIPRLVVFSLTETTCAGDNISDLVEHTTDPAHYIHVTATLSRVSDSLTITPILQELDITIENSLARIPSLTQNYFASHIGEAQRDTTVSIKTAKTGENFLMDIARERPQDNIGRLNLGVVIDVPNAFFMNLGMPTVNLSDPSRDQTQDSDFVEESFAGALVGAPTMDMNKAA